MANAFQRIKKLLGMRHKPSGPNLIRDLLYPALLFEVGRIANCNVEMKVEGDALVLVDPNDDRKETIFTRDELKTDIWQREFSARVISFITRGARFTIPAQLLDNAAAEAVELAE